MTAFTKLPAAFSRLAIRVPLVARAVFRKQARVPTNRITNRLDQIMVPYRQHSNVAVARLERIMAPYRLSA